MSGKFIYIGNKNWFLLFPCRATHSLSVPDTRTGNRTLKWPEHKLFVDVGEVEVDAVEVETRQLVDMVGAKGGVRLVGEQCVRPARAQHVERRVVELLAYVDHAHGVSRFRHGDYTRGL